MSKFKGIFFDLDGTLIDSKLNFDRMREELLFPKDAPILEEIDKIKDHKRRDNCLEIVHQHELEGAKNSVLIEGVAEMLDSMQVPTGVLTRNSRVCAEMMLSMHNLSFDHLLTREDCAPKPNPAGLMKLANLHKLDVRDCLYVGDFLFDIQTAHNAGMKAALYSPSGASHGPADFQFKNYHEFQSRFL